MATVAFLLAALVGVLSIWSTLKSGNAGGQIERRDRPVLYWLFLGAAVLLVAAFLYLAVAGVQG